MHVHLNQQFFAKICFESYFIGMFSDFPNQILRPTAAAVEMNEFELGGCNATEEEICILQNTLLHEL